MVEERWGVGERVGRTAIGAAWKSLKKTAGELMGDNEFKEGADKKGGKILLGVGCAEGETVCVCVCVCTDGENAWKLEVIEPMRRRDGSDTTGMEESYAPDLREELLDD